MIKGLQYDAVYSETDPVCTQASWSKGWRLGDVLNIRGKIHLLPALQALDMIPRTDPCGDSLPISLAMLLH